MADLIRKFTPAATLITDKKLIVDSIKQAYTIDPKTLAKGEEVLMSHTEFVGGMKNIIGVPVTITPDGKQPIFPDIEAEELKPIEDIKVI
jgi:hypothetical protein